MYKEYNMAQLILPMETSVLIPTNDISRRVNDIVEIPETEFRHHRGATSYHPKMMLKVVQYTYTQSVFSGRKIDVEPVFGFMKTILGFTCMSVRRRNKAKRELGFVLMTLNIIKVTAQRAENTQKSYKKDNFYIISIEIVFIYLS
ncbi:transposase [Staphylococcus epidermidis]|uniref:transposase n=1 Tax=Staphylococcus epidermidis TaxID=1282 RepID=UPI0002432E89|nr:transposase [Staphylococcus epidermidis]EHM71797.1 hypothetical protein HMPREF9956_0460 [Staphylococcus epidermidis 14.1.R1.SE]MCD9068915.1 hypothetical protein [Staphylococcus epidermidis]MCD9073400.1 hypothetical protein [Staphylococcus epidermidis]MDU0427706.1 hypothetical protein [Staphylococcus epidermidis]MDU0432597.1 hypothetical protein [Staphylococcus epidermidis]